MLYITWNLKSRWRSQLNPFQKRRNFVLNLRTHGSKSVTLSENLVPQPWLPKASGLIETSLLDMPNINSEFTAQEMYNVCDEVIDDFSLNWDNCITYPSDNTNSMVGAHNSLLTKIKDSQDDQKVFDALVT